VGHVDIFLPPVSKPFPLGIFPAIHFITAQKKQQAKRLLLPILLQ
jgi:hypothetical protein